MNFKQVLEKYGYPVVSKKQSDSLHKLRDCNLSEKYRNYLLNGDKRGNMGKLSNQWHYLIDAPFLISDRCCHVMKKEPIHRYEKENGGHPITGVIAEESNMRTQQYLKNGGCNAFDIKEPISSPLGFWTNQDILKYLITQGKFYPCSLGEIPIRTTRYASIYGDIIKQGNKLVTTGLARTGCMFCMFGAHLEQEPNRFQRMQISHPKRYDYCINGGQFVDGAWGPSKKGLGLGYILKYIHVPWNNDNEGLWSIKQLIKQQ